MTYDGEDDLFNEEFDFVDEDDSELEDEIVDSEEDEEEPEEKPKPKKKAPAAKSKGRSPRKKKPAKKDKPTDNQSDEVSADEPAEGEEKSEEEKAPEPPPGPPTDHVVHLYEFGDFTRTIPREFTSEDAEAFAKEYNRTSNAHARQAVAAGKDEEAPLSVTPVK